MKKAQAAMEFLMTYGWAVLIVLAAIAALAYMGVLNPDRYLPDRCTMPAGIACLDYTITGNTVKLTMQNAAGIDMTNPTINLTTDTTNPECTTDNTTTHLANSQKATFNIQCTNLPLPGQKFKAKIIIIYTNTATNIPHEQNGELTIRMP